MATDTPHRIITAARRLLDEEGAEAVTMRRVAEPIGVTAMTIYRHFPNRAALLNALADDGFSELAAALAAKRYAGSAEERLLKMMDVFLDFSLRTPRLFALMFLEKREGARQFPEDFIAGRSPTASLLAVVVAEGIENGELRQDNPWEIVFGLGALAHGLTLLYLGGRIEASPARFRALYRRAFRRLIDGIRG